MRLLAPTAAVLLFATGLPVVAQTTYGPTPYLSAADSPFPLGSPAFVLEDFEDHLLNAPGVSSPSGFVTSTQYPGFIIDSVDGDDGVLGNGACSNCDSYFDATSSSATFVFDAGVLGGLPTKVGIVWTDGPAGGATVIFQAFDAADALIASVVGTGIGDGSNSGETAEDRFFGVEHAGGIKKIMISHGSAIEVDHLQYDLPCTSIPVTTYCTAKASSNGCVPSMSSSGIPSLSSPSSFLATASQVDGTQVGLMYFGTTGQNNAPFLGGVLCVKAPLYRLKIKTAGGTSGQCNGTFNYALGDMLLHPSGGSLVVAGQVVTVQLWYRDPPSASTVGLSNGLQFVVCP